MNISAYAGHPGLHLARRKPSQSAPQVSLLVMAVQTMLWMDASDMVSTDLSDKTLWIVSSVVLWSAVVSLICSSNCSAAVISSLPLSLLLFSGGEYAGELGEYAGELGEYAGELGKYACELVGDVGQNPPCLGGERERLRLRLL